MVSSEAIFGFLGSQIWVFQRIGVAVCTHNWWVRDRSYLWTSPRRSWVDVSGCSFDVRLYYCAAERPSYPGTLGEVQLTVHSLQVNYVRIALTEEASGGF